MVVFAISDWRPMSICHREFLTHCSHLSVLKVQMYLEGLYDHAMNCRSSKTQDSVVAIRVMIKGAEEGSSAFAARYSGLDGIELVKFDHAEPHMKLKRQVLFLLQNDD
jgi:hypothetical protein